MKILVPQSPARAFMPARGSTAFRSQDRSGPVARPTGRRRRLFPALSAGWVASRLVACLTRPVPERQGLCRAFRFLPKDKLPGGRVCRRVFLGNAK